MVKAACSGHSQWCHRPGNPGARLFVQQEMVSCSLSPDSNIGGPGAEYLESANHVTIKHADGSYAEYVHLKQNGVLVHLNEHVKKGQIIALSGNTGQSTGPHLHFCIYYYDQNEIRHSVPFYMLTKNGPTKVFTVGKLLQP
jgi:murein DD-endopeptidase MepM/ murein hydrolase activator NlpD